MAIETQNVGNKLGSNLTFNGTGNLTIEGGNYGITANGSLIFAGSVNATIIGNNSANEVVHVSNGGTTKDVLQIIEGANLTVENGTSTRAVRNASADGGILIDTTGTVTVTNPSTASWSGGIYSGGSKGIQIKNGTVTVNMTGKVGDASVGLYSDLGPLYITGGKVSVNMENAGTRTCAVYARGEVVFGGNAEILFDLTNSSAEANNGGVIYTQQAEGKSEYHAYNYNYNVYIKDNVNLTVNATNS